MGISYFDPRVSGRNRVRNTATTKKKKNMEEEKNFLAIAAQFSPAIAPMT